MSYEKIKQSALLLFARRGYEGTTVKEIAAMSGLKPSSIYSHVKSKEELFVTIWRECMQNASNSLQEIHKYGEESEQYDAEKILHQYHSSIIMHFVKNRYEYLFLKQTAYFTRLKEESKDNSFTDFMINKNTVKFFSKFFSQLRQERRIINESDEKLFYIYIGTIIAYLEEKLVFKLPLEDKYLEKFWGAFWNTVKEEKGTE